MKKGSKCLMSMFNSNDFLNLIQEGKISPDTITKDFTEALNAALAAKKQADEAAAKKKAEEPAAPPAPSAEEKLLTEIRDLLKEKN